MESNDLLAHGPEAMRVSGMRGSGESAGTAADRSTGTRSGVCAVSSVLRPVRAFNIQHTE